MAARCAANIASIRNLCTQKVYGRTMTASKLYEEVRQDELYFLATNGGITFGGGEPCLQSDFIYEFRQLCGQEWQLSVETSLNVTQENIEKLVPVVDSYIIDIKDINNTIYQKYTGKIMKKSCIIFNI